MPTQRGRKGGKQRGGAMLYLLASVSLFAALSYTFLHGTRTSTAAMQSKGDEATAIAGQQCETAARSAIERLESKGCSLISWADNGASSRYPDGSCSVFHTNGGGVKPCDASAFDAYCVERRGNLAVGEKCGEFSYVGVVAGARRYASITTTGKKHGWNSGKSCHGCFVPNGAASPTDGYLNTTILMGFTTGPDGPYSAAQACRAKGSNWYLPARAELAVLYAAQNQGVFALMKPRSVWASTEAPPTRAVAYHFHQPARSMTVDFKNIEYEVICFWRE